MKLNLNDNIKVKLNAHGIEIFAKYYEEANKSMPMDYKLPLVPEIDKDGYTKFQLWGFIKLYGPYIHAGAEPIIENNEIIIGE